MPFDGIETDWNSDPAPGRRPGRFLLGLKKLAVTAATGCAVLLPVQQVAGFAAGAVDALLGVPPHGSAGLGMSIAALIAYTAVFTVDCVGFACWGVWYWMDDPVYLAARPACPRQLRQFRNWLQRGGFRHGRWL